MKRKPSKPHFQPKGSSKSPVVQSAHRSDDVIHRLQQQNAGLRPVEQGQFVDLTVYDPDDYMESLNVVADVKRRFAALPSALRSACLNDPRQLLRLAADAHSGDEVAVALLKRHGLSVTPPKAPEAAPKDGPGDGSIPLE